MAFKGKKKYQETSDLVKSVDQVVESQEKNAPESVSGLAKIFIPEKNERSTTTITVRIKPSVKNRFLKFCKVNGLTQSDAIAYWITTACDASNIK